MHSPRAEWWRNVPSWRSRCESTVLLWLEFAQFPRCCATEMCFLCTTSGISRCWRAAQGESSDLMGLFAPKSDSDVHQVRITVQQIAFRETNEAGEMPRGQATKRRDTRLCTIGVMLLHLQVCFHCAEEFVALQLPTGWMIHGGLTGSRWLASKLQTLMRKCRMTRVVITSVSF